MIGTVLKTLEKKQIVLKVGKLVTYGIHTAIITKEHRSLIHSNIEAWDIIILQGESFAGSPGQYLHLISPDDIKPFYGTLIIQQ